jgi:Flp pilus assembly protein TadD
VVAQASHGTPQIGVEMVAAGVPVHLVPVVSGAFLYPYHGVLHPANPIEDDGILPFAPEFNDRYLAKLFMAKVEPGEALRRYRNCDVAAEASVGRLYEMTIDRQRKLDAQTGFASADIIERLLSEEKLFEMAFHFGHQIASHLAAPLCDRIGFDPKFGQRIRDHLRESPFVPLSVPVHPSIAGYFDMRWANDDTRFAYRFEGGFTFDEYVLRFMEARWSKALQAGVMAAQRADPGAKALLQIGMEEAPRSAEGPQALSLVLEREGDMEAAVAQQRVAVSRSSDARMPMRLGHLLLRKGDVAGAESAFRRATALDPVSHDAWFSLSRVLLELGQGDAARVAARQAALFTIDADTNPAPVSSSVAGAPVSPRGFEAKAVAIPEAGTTIDVVAHIQNQGDTISNLEGWAGTPGSKLAVEGFTILESPASLAAGFTCQAVLADMSLAAPVGVGDFCGTRGENMPLYGFRVSIDAKAVANLEVACEAWFLDGEHIGPVPAGTMCKAKSPAPLEAFRILFADAARGHAETDNR